MQKKITTCLWFDKQAEEAAKLYTSLIEGSKITTVTPMVVNFELAGQQFMGINGGPKFPQTEAASIFVSCKDQEEIDRLWAKLIEDGGSPSQCGWLKDKFGVSWQLVPSVLMELAGDKDPEKSKRVWAALMKMSKIEIAELKNAWTG